MIRAYLDTGIFLVAYERDGTNSGRVLEAAEQGAFLPVVSSLVFRELMHNLRRRHSKDDASWMRYYLWTLEGLEVVTEDRIRALGDLHREKVADVTDLPHIKAYVAAGCERFVTVNRRLTRMAVRDVVAFRSPREFLEELGLPSEITEAGV